MENKNLKNIGSRLIAVLLLMVMTVSGIPLEVSAQTLKPKEKEIEHFYYLDGESIPKDDERIINIATVLPSRLRSSLPNVESVGSMSGAFAQQPNVTMNGNNVSARRYIVKVDGIEYEAFCADPNLPGPESSGAVYEIKGDANASLLNVLKNGYPINSEMSDITLTADERMHNVYITRVAVAMANNSSATFDGDAEALSDAQSLVNGSTVVQGNYQYGILLDGEQNADDLGRLFSASNARSNAFNITHNRKTNAFYNHFRFEWDAGTPAGAKLIVNGSVVATAPTNPTTIYKNDISSFNIEMPNTPAFEGQTAKINLVGVHNEFANRAFVLQHATSPNTWQDIVFFIPEIVASASFSFQADEPTTTPTPSPTPTPTPGIPTLPEPKTAEPPSVRIQKVDAITRENIPGALIRLEGMSSHQVVTGDGQLWEIDNTGININVVLTAGHTLPVVPEPSEDGRPPVEFELEDGVLTIHNIPWGYYRVQEERAPDGYSLLPQHTAYSFWALPPNITVIAGTSGGDGEEDEEEPAEDDDESEEESGGGLEYIIDEEENINSILITFENFPFGEIEVTKYDEATGETLAGAHFRIQGYFPEGNPNGMPIDRTEVTGGDGTILFEDLPAGQYTISEIQAPPGYQLDSTAFRSLSITWGQTATTTFYNKPKTFVEVIKVDGNTGALLDGAIFRLSDPTTGETWEGTTSGGKVRLGEGDGSFGNQLVEGKLYILTEIQAPNGYVLNPAPHQVIVAADNQLNTITVQNYRNPTLTIVKRDKNNGQPRLGGAVFEVEYENGASVSGSPFTTNANGEIIINEVLFEGNQERTLIVTEIIPPDGYHLSNPNWQKVTMRQGEDNVITFENTRKPTLEIIKVDGITGQNLAGAEFTIEKLEEPGKGMLTGNPFTTNANGRITLPFQYSGKYRIVETKAPNNYWLDPQQQNREWIIEILDNEDYTLRVENSLLPTLIITKWNHVTYKPVPMTHFRIEYEVPNSSQVQFVGEFVTNSSGQIVIPYTRVGWYRITEIKAAPGMSLNSNNSYRLYLNPGDNSYMPIPDVTGNNPNLNTDMPVFKDIQVFGGNDFFVGGAEQYSFPEGSIVALGTANESFTLANASSGIMAMSSVQVNVNADVIGEFSADSSGILVLGGLEAASYSITNAEGRTETAALLNDGSIARFDFTAINEPITPEPPTTPTTPPSVPDVETGGIFDGEIEMVDNPVLASQISQYMSANNGTQYWNSGMGIWNWPLNSIVIKKQDATNGNLLAGATFDVIYTTAGESGTKGTVIGTFTTDHSGIIVITGLEPGNYVVEEIQAPPNYTLSLNNRQNVNLKPDGTSIVEVTFSNYPYGSLLINKIDSITRAPLAGAQFFVTDSRGTVVGTANGLFTTDSAGNILIEKLQPDTYIVTEQRAPNGYVIGVNATQTIQVQPDGRVYRLEFTNDPLSSLIIRKIDSFDGSPLAGARFEVRRVNGEFIGEFTTDQQGLIEIPNILGWFTVTEMEAPSGYAVDTNAVRTVEVRSISPTYVTFYNPREGSLTIEKSDRSGSPLAGAQFRVTRQSGEFVGNHTTGASGMINLANLSAGWYHVEEIHAPNGYIISQAGQSVEVRPNTAAHLTFVNLPQPMLTIQKVDETGNPLSGARFIVSEIGGSFSREVTIGAGGTASLVLPITAPQANFQIVETQAPNGYIITEPSRVITVRAGENHFESFVNYRTPSLVINKLDAAGNPLSGADFEVRTLDGALVATARSNNGGVAAIGSIAPGSYEVMETRAPAGYAITEQSQIIQIKAGDTATLTFINERMPGLTIEKVDENGNPLSGAEFEVRTLAGALVQRVTTNNGGVANIAAINAGSYTIEETRAPNGYVITEQTRNIEISAGQHLTERFVNLRQPSIVIEKVDDNGQPLANATFEVRTLSGTRIAEVKTNNGGMTVVERLEPGFYEVAETQAPSGYMIIEQSRIITVSAGDIATVRFVNFRQPSLVIEKVDEDGNPLGNAEFEVRRLNGELIQRVVTNNSGTASIAVIAPGVYVISETRAPHGFAVTEVARNIEIVAGQNFVERFINYRNPSLVIEKVDNDGNPLSGAVFEVRTLTGTRIAEITTNSGGMATVANLEPGAYEVVETLAPQGFVITETSRAIQIVAGEVRTERFVNQRQPSLVIEKVDEDGNPLAGAEFEVRRLNGELIQRLTTNNAGVASIAVIPPGAYVIVETRAPQGYVITEVARNIEIVAGQSITERFVNYRQPSLVIEKVDNDGNPLSGAVFEVRTLTGTRIAEVTTNSGGMATVPNLEPGAYEVVETRAPQGFVITETSRSIQIVAGQIKTERFVNQRQPSLVIEKVDEDGNPLAGAEFEVRRLNGELVQRLTTNNSGVASVSQLAPGAYVISETRAPQGYVITEVARNIEVTAGESLTERFVNYRQPSLILEKVDNDGNPLSGAVFEVRTLTGTRIAEITTNSGGMATVPNLEPGAYEVVETRAPQGFVVTELSRAIQIVAGETKTERFVNYRQPSLIIEKVDENGQPLAGAEFEIRRLNGELVHRVVTSNGGTATIEQLAPNSYEIIETRAPEGYAIVEVSRAIQIVAGQTITERFVNPRLATFVIQKIDGDTSQPLSGVRFEITTLEGEKVRNPQNGSFEFITDNAGMIRLPMLDAGSYVAVETRALPGYALAQPEVFVVGHDRDYLITVRNYRLPDYNIKKIDGNTNEPLAGVQFELAYYYANGRVGDKIRNPQDGSFTWVTDSAGIIRFPNLEHGAYIATEIRPLAGYRPAEPSVFVVGDNQPTTITVRNYRFSEWNILKLDGDTNQPLQGVIFEVAHYFGDGSTGDKLRNSITGSMEFTTSAEGLIRLGVLEPGTYIATEIRTLDGYIKAEPTVFVVTENDVNTTVTIRNYKLPTYNIRKIDGNTNLPLQGVVFEIARYFDNGSSGERIRNPVNGSFEFVTDAAGLIAIPTLPHATYVATEIRPLNGYAAAEPQIFVVGDNQDTTITIRNYKRPDYTIRKLDSDTQQPLQGVQFNISHYLGGGRSGEMLRNPADGGYIWTTDRAGLIHLNALEPGNYIATEIRALPGYAVAEPKTFTVGDNGDTTITIYNHRLPDYAIKKIDGDTNRALPGVEFEIAHHLGEGRNGERLVNPKDGTTIFITDNAGMIHLPSLEPGNYVAVETHPLNGYTAAEPVIFNVGANNTDRTILIRNYRQAELTIQKINAINRRPLEGVIFQISRPNGEKLVNPQTGNHDFRTDGNGIISLPVITDGDYYLTETRALSGFIPLDAPIRFSINSETRQRQHLLVVENTPASGLVIIKRDASTKEPLAGVIFEIRYPDGRLVQGVMEDGNQPNTSHNSPQLNATNGFATDNRGCINLNHLAPGVYHVKEVKALDGYILDSTVHVVTVEPGKQAVLEVENKSLAGLRIKKIDSVTKQGIYNVEFMLFDSSGKVVGNFYSDNNGIVEFPANIVSGRYTIRETRPAPGYAADDMPRTIDFVAGKVTEIVWENVPMGGQLQISKVSGDYNEMNALQPGTPLMGAIFEIYNARTGNVVDRIISNERGMAVSKPLPLGRYYAQEVQAPAFYKINPEPIHFDIEFDTQIIKAVFPNFSANVGVNITKTGPQEVMQGNNINYDIRNVRNESTIPLADFFWRDVLPTNAVRVDKLVTGTYNFQLRYKIMGKTNKGNEIVIADNLSSTKNNVVELKPAHLGLASDEYLEEFSIHFGQVPAGFAMVETAKVFVDVLPTNMANLPNGMMIVNKVDAGGRIPGATEWVISNDTHGSTLYKPATPGRIPQSGW